MSYMSIPSTSRQSRFLTLYVLCSMPLEELRHSKPKRKKHQISSTNTASIGLGSHDLSKFEIKNRDSFKNVDIDWWINHPLKKIAAFRWKMIQSIETVLFNSAPQRYFYENRNDILKVAYTTEKIMFLSSRSFVSYTNSRTIYRRVEVISHRLAAYFIRKHSLRSSMLRKKMPLLHCHKDAAPAA